MARLTKRDHARILELVDVEQRKVQEVAAEYGCSPTNIYTLLSKLRRTALSQTQRPDMAAAEALPAASPSEPPTPRPADLFAATEWPTRATPPHVAAKLVAPAPQAISGTVTELPQKRGGIGATLAKPGFGLTMRTADGDEKTTPFRSLEDLLSAVKPFLRASARSPDPVWFSIQAIDLSSIEFDAA